MQKVDFIEFVKNEKPCYINDNLKIQFIRYNQKGSFFSAKHYGWTCPSMYHDSPVENGCCYICDYDYKSGLFLNFESDDYAQTTYLVLKVVDKNTLEITYDQYKISNPGTKLYLSALPSTQMSY